ncbi:mitochondrial 54S ribosomal protein uL22m MRPL22 [Sporobolomyces koalae]|uniref:mitochondrial 54S ribosomal protein uL22m MRPL22 n=1 Tax=Sporobolomyces koalae TaxID=500713 RepID=UPI00317DAB25
MQSSRSALQTLHTLSRALPVVPRSTLSSQRRHASFSLSSIRDMFPRRKKEQDAATNESGSNASADSAVNTVQEQPKGLFDQVVEQEQVALARESQPHFKTKQPTFHKSSTANFKTSKRKLNDLARLVAGRTADEALLQLQATQKKQAPRLLSMIALARDHAIAKGLKREKLVIAQSWVTQGPSIARIDIKGRGRHGIKHHPSSKLHVLLAEGETKEQLRRQRKQDQWRQSLRGLTQGTEFGNSKPLINAGVGQWKW